MTIYLVRHAHAGARSAWDGDDTIRPLSTKGRAQVQHLLAVLADEPIERVYTSPSQRCIETVEPLAEDHGVKVTKVEILNEGGDADKAVKFLLKNAHKHVVLCSHGDVIPKMLRRLSAAGMRATDGNTANKGSVWKLEIDADSGTVVRGTYFPGTVD